MGGKRIEISQNSLQIAIGSASELEYQIQFALHTELISSSDCKALGDQVIEVRGMLYGLLRRVQDAE